MLLPMRCFKASYSSNDIYRNVGSHVVTKLSHKIIILFGLSSLCTFFLSKCWDENYMPHNWFLDAVSFFPYLLSYFSCSQGSSDGMGQLGAFLQFFVIFSIAYLFLEKMLNGFINRKSGSKSEKI